MSSDGSVLRLAFEGHWEWFSPASIAMLGRNHLLRKHLGAFEGRYIIFSCVHNGTFGIWWHRYCWRNSDSFFRHNIRSSDTSFHVPVGNRTQLTGITKAIDGNKNQQLWRNTYILHVKDWRNTVAFFSFLITSGAGSFLHNSLQSLCFCTETPVLQLKRLDSLRQCNLLCLCKDSFFLCIPQPPLQIFRAWRKLVLFCGERINSRGGHCAPREKGANGNSVEEELRFAALVKISMSRFFGPASRLTEVFLLQEGSWRSVRSPCEVEYLSLAVKLGATWLEV